MLGATLQRLCTAHGRILVRAMHPDAPLVDDAAMVNDFAHEPLVGSADVIDALA